MIPSNSGFLQQNFVVREQPTFTYAMDLEKLYIRGYTDKLKAMEQAVYKIIFTERYEWIIYTPNYGIQLYDLFGEPISWVIPEVKRRIIEALEWDDRINRVHSFTFQIPRRGVLYTTFRVDTIHGDFMAERTVNF